MREYKDLPHPINEPEKFNQYLRDHNTVIDDGHSWLTIRNSYIKGQLVVFSKRSKEDIGDLTLKEWRMLLPIFEVYPGHHIYINDTEDQSIPNRLHFHIKL